MAKKSIGDLHSEITANAAQFVSEFNRADNAARRHGASIQRELDQLSKKTAAKFSLGDVGKDLLKGSGVFGGFQIAETVRDKVTDHYREQADLAKTIEESTARQLDLTKELISLRQNPLQQRDTLQKDFAAAGQRLETFLKKDREVMLPDSTAVDYVRDWTTAETKEILELTEAYQKLGAEIEKRRHTDEDRAAALRRQRFNEAFNKGVEDYNKRLADGEAIRRKRFNEGFNKGVQELEAATKKTLEEIQTPADKLAARLAEITRLREAGLLTADQGQRAMDNSWRQYANDSDPTKNSLTAGIFQRWQQAAGSLRIDDLTRRGLGTGANYEDRQAKIDRGLTDLIDLLRRWLNAGTGAPATAAYFQ